MKWRLRNNEKYLLKFHADTESITLKRAYMTEPENSTNDNNFFARILKYLSDKIIPILIIPIFAGVVYGYNAININKIEVNHVKKEIDRISVQHNSMIQENRIGMEQMGKRITAFEVTMPQILQGIDDIKNDIKADIKVDIKSMKKDIGKMENTVAVLKDRDERGKIK